MKSEIPGIGTAHNFNWRATRLSFPIFYFHYFIFSRQRSRLTTLVM